tara:strand:- start:6007 stop:6117 length:111 start_codon:yes stop_codon:yes gene_type:complete
MSFNIKNLNLENKFEKGEFDLIIFFIFGVFIYWIFF